MKTVLIIAYAFPPAGYVGSLRTLKFCKYLPSVGWKPIVLTVNYTSTEYRDENALMEIPKEAIVYRTFDCDPIKWFSRKGNRGRMASNNKIKKPYVAFRKLNMLAKIKAFIFQLLSIPDIHVFWIPFAVMKSIHIMLRHHIDIVYCSSPPHSSHIIALILSKLFRKPYIADFRDPWAASSIHMKNSKILIGIDRYIEKRVFREASKIVTVSHGCVREMSKNTPQSVRRKFVVINNGFDAKDFETEAVPNYSTNSKKLILAHIGTLYKGIADDFFSNIITALANEKALVDKLEIRLVGGIPEQYEEAIRTTNLGFFMKHLGYRTHLEALKCMRESDVLLLLIREDQYIDGVLPAKMFEYMATGKPILAVTKENEASAIIKESNLGIIIDPQDEAAFLDVIQRLYEEKKKKGNLHRHSNANYIRRFERRNLTKRLASVFDEVLHASS